MSNTRADAKSTIESLESTIEVFRTTIECAQNIRNKFSARDLDKDKIMSLYGSYKKNVRILDRRVEADSTFDLDQQLIPLLLMRHAKKDYGTRYDYLGEDKIPETREQHRDFIIKQLDRISKETTSLIELYSNKITAINRDEKLLREIQQQEVGLAGVKAGIVIFCELTELEHAQKKKLSAKEKLKFKCIVTDSKIAATELADNKMTVDEFKSYVHNLMNGFILSTKKSNFFGYSKNEFLKDSKKKWRSQYAYFIARLIDDANALAEYQKKLDSLNAAKTPAPMRQLAGEANALPHHQVTFHALPPGRVNSGSTDQVIFHLDEETVGLPSYR